MKWTDEQLVPISALQHYEYCSRQCSLIHVEQVWDENIYTLRGGRAHERVDTPATEWRDGERREFALPIWSESLGLTGRGDVVIFEDSGRIYPVEHKIGSRKAKAADDVQLCAQALCLEEMFGCRIEVGDVYYVATRRRRSVLFTRELREHVEQLTLAVRELLDRRIIPPPVADNRCDRCSLIETCMPTITDFIRSERGEYL
jgi:CRISPR-associated exonuclease Cas4